MGAEAKLYPRLLSPEGLNPKSCEICPPESQLLYWRTFTPEKLRYFMQYDYCSPVINLPSLKVGNLPIADGYKIVRDDIEAPGFIWTSPEPSFALEVGLTRAVLEKTNAIYLLGVNHCHHSAKAGAQGYKVLANGKYALLKPVRLQPVDAGDMTEGTLFNKLTPTQVKAGVLYQVDPRFLRSLKQICTAVKSTEKNEEDVLSAVMDLTFNRLAELMGLNYIYDVHKLNEIFDALLVPLPIQLVTDHQEIHPSQKVNKSPQSEIVQRLFLTTFISLMERRKHLKTRGVLFADLGSDFRIKYLSDQLPPLVEQLTRYESSFPEYQALQYQIEVLQSKIRQMRYFRGEGL